jgi:ATP diphosphatase
MSDIQRLLEIMARLRDPDGGCPWDLEQDFASISPHTIEEAYEVDEAIERGDPEALRDELGDLLFQVVFQARIAEEKGLFDWRGVVGAIVEKLIRRHPHVFADGEAPRGRAEQFASWESLKAAERAEAVTGDDPPDPFEGIPRRLPALARSAKVSSRLARLDREGRQRLNSEERASAPSEHVASVRAAIEAIATPALRAEPPDRQSGPDAGHVSPEIRVALGEGLQAWVRLARSLGLDAEQALREADDRTQRRARGA